MIKFKALIHKETGTVIKYEDWEKAAATDNFITINKDRKVFINPKSIFKAKEMLFLDDFEIIYDSEFTIEELRMLYSCEIPHLNVKNKIFDKILEKSYHNEKYGI